MTLTDAPDGTPDLETLLAEWNHRFDHYAGAARLCEELLDDALGESGIRHIVSHRAKTRESLEKKCRTRNVNTPYRTWDDIESDIVDLGGVRVALYFPGDLPEAKKIVRKVVGGTVKTFGDVILDKHTLRERE